MHHSIYGNLTPTDVQIGVAPPMTHNEIARIIAHLDLYRHYIPQSQEDFADIIKAANELLKAAGAK